MYSLKALILKYPANAFTLRSAIRTLGCAALLAVSSAAHAADLGPATTALLQGNADLAVAQLKQVLSSDPSNGQAHLLLCRAYYTQSMASAAASECAAALRTLSNDSTAQDWAGRPYG